MERRTQNERNQGNGDRYRTDEEDADSSFPGKTRPQPGLIEDGADEVYEKCVRKEDPTSRPAV